MSILRKVKAVEKVFDNLEKEINSFQLQTGLHCIAGCGKCCNKPDIDATPLEFLPLAFHWYSQGRAPEMHEQLAKSSSPICTIYNPLTLEDKVNGNCSVYKHRGLICRLFGYGANADKYGQLRLVTCKIIKEQQVENYAKAIADLANNDYVPVFSDYYKKLMQIDFGLANKFLPINEAIKEALEAVMQYYSYRPFRKSNNAA